jgi:Helix-turn-helix domain
VSERLFHVEWAVAVRDDPRPSANAKHVGLTLMTYMNPIGWCCPSRSTLAEKMSRDRKTVDRGLRELEEFGYLSITKGGGLKHPNEYQARRLPLANGGTTPPNSGDATAETEAPVPEAVAPVPAKGGVVPPEHGLNMKEHRAAAGSPEEVEPGPTAVCAECREEAVLADDRRCPVCYIRKLAARYGGGLAA